MAYNCVAALYLPYLKPSKKCMCVTEHQLILCQVMYWTSVIYMFEGKMNVSMNLNWHHSLFIIIFTSSQLRLRFHNKAYNKRAWESFNATLRTDSRGRCLAFWVLCARKWKRNTDTENKTMSNKKKRNRWIEKELAPCGATSVKN